VPVVAKMLLGIDITPRSIFSLTNFLFDFCSIPDCAVKNPVGTTTAAFPLSDKRKNNMLDK